MGKWENISLGENDNFPCHKTAQVERVIAFFATNRDKF
jgi:hypothetical protein